MTVDQYKRLIVLTPLLEDEDYAVRKQAAEEVLLITEVPYIEWEYVEFEEAV